MGSFINSDILHNKIKQNGLKLAYIAEQLNITPQAFSKKIKNRSEFKISEVNKIAEILQLSLEEKNQIFFCLFQTLKESE